MKKLYLVLALGLIKSLGAMGTSNNNGLSNNGLCICLPALKIEDETTLEKEETPAFEIKQEMTMLEIMTNFKSIYVYRFCDIPTLLVHSNNQNYYFMYTNPKKSNTYSFVGHTEKIAEAHGAFIHRVIFGKCFRPYIRTPRYASGSDTE